ncbi:MAG: Rpn family recombination-promoting nuclease/putative transposase [Desulfamplus sp.]
MPYVKPTSDIFIKYLLGSEDNKDLLLSFINGVMENSGFPLIKSVEIRNPFNLKKMVHEKQSILDIKAIDENGRIFNIEMQVSGDETFRHRSLYYWAKLYSSQLNEGELYEELLPVVCINLLEFEMFRQFDKYHSTFMLCDTKKADFVLTDHFAIHFIELPKFRTFDININRDETLQKWLYFLKKEGMQEEDNLMEILLKEDATFRKAHEKYAAFTQDEEMLEAYEAHQKWVRDYNSGISSAWKKGKKEGEIVG